MASDALRKDIDLVWVVPMVGDVAYPVGQLVRGDPFEVCISNKRFFVEVFYHVVHNVTYVMLSSPVFRECTKGDPYPPRMDDMASAVYYSTFNQCQCRHKTSRRGVLTATGIAETCRRFSVDLYHVNDYHGALAPLYLLPLVIPISVSLHNAEFQVSLNNSSTTAAH